MIKLDKHVFTAGMTGSGKTFLLKSYLAHRPQLVVKYDTKGEALDDIKNGKNPWPQIHPKELIIVQRLDDVIYADKDKYKRIIYAPTYEELNKESYDNFFEWSYKRKNNTAWVDELLEIVDNPHVIPIHMKAILTRGRSRNNTLWSCTQRPLGIPPLCISQSHHIFAFTLNLDQDRKKIAEVTGVDGFLHNPQWHSFNYWEIGWTASKRGMLV